jgi:trimethylamine---corrinoid protein Co-methyltransferase
MVREGSPVIFAGSSSGAEMRTGGLSIGSPEMAMNCSATAQMARFYKLPSRGGGAVSDSKAPDPQAAYESMMNLMMAQVAGINFVLHSAGIIEAYNCMSYEKFIIDDEICSMVKRIKRGYEIDEDTLGFDAIKETGPGGHFLDKLHTFRHFRKELFQPVLGNRDDFDTWQASGSMEITERAMKRCSEIIENHDTPELATDIEKDLKTFVDGT